jgi:hypothetical protein
VLSRLAALLIRALIGAARPSCRNRGGGGMAAQALLDHNLTTIKSRTCTAENRSDRARFDEAVASVELEAPRLSSPGRSSMASSTC